MFEPLGEKLWADGWDPLVLYLHSGMAQIDMVFTVAGHPGTPGIWTVCEYCPEEYRLAYIAVQPDTRVTRITIRCELGLEDDTLVHVMYTHTSVTDAGNDYIDSLDDQQYGERMEEWQAAINGYLTDGVPRRA